MNRNAFRRSTPAGKQRVRTGCLTCRRRRRKCDERKPRCLNCEIKRFSCSYPPDLTFVSVVNPRQDGGSNSISAAYGAITFVDDGPHPSNPASSDGGIQSPQIPNTPTFQERHASRESPGSSTNDEISSTAISLVPSNVVRRPELRGDAPLQTVCQNASGLPITRTEEPSAAAERPNKAQDRTFQAASFSTQLLSRQVTTSSSKETGLLRHFRYNVAPWIDVSDPDCSFGIKIMLLGRTKRPLLAAILALASRQRSLIHQPQNQEDLESSFIYREEAEQGLEFEEDSIRRIGQALLMLIDFFSSSPLQWRKLPLLTTGTLDGFASLAGLEDELSKPAFWLHFRIDLAASIVSGKPPLTPFSSYLLSNGLSRGSFRWRSQRHLTKQIYQHSLVLLHHCLSAIYYDSSASAVPRPSPPGMAAFQSLQHSSLSTRWTSLWTDCQKWYNDRPAEVRQILDIRGAETGQIDAQNTSSFPILLYTTPLALISNFVYHITSLLLLIHKPRLLRSLDSGPSCFLSPTWHIQSIAGIATSNESLEQWDPILIAGLLLIAKGMTHETQQSMLAKRLSGVTAMTGIKLDLEIEALTSGWDVSRHGEETVT